jgi:hypothetical protein
MAVSQTAVPPHVAIWQTTNAIVASRALHVVAELGVADYIDEGPVPVQALAAACGADATALDRILRLLASNGIFERTPEGYAHSDASRVLRSDAPGSMGAFARMMNLRFVNEMFTELEQSVRSGDPAVKLVEPRGFWAYLGDHPELARVFGEAMQSKSAADIAAVLGAYDFSRFATVADIGGGLGHLLRAILTSSPATTGILFDLPEVIGSTSEPPERLTPVSGDFFRDALPRADAYLLMEVLHDWSDEDCVRILSAIRRSAAPGAKVLVIEGVVPEAGDDPRVNTLDVVMLTVTGGRERTSSELARLFEKGGFRLHAVVPTEGAMQIVEGDAVS